MWQLYQFPLCPFSRKVRLMLAEKGVAHELKRVSPWAQDDDFADLNPAGETPVLLDERKGAVLIDSGAICEYFEETVEKAPMIPGTSINRAEVRRLAAWFDGRMHREVVAPLMEERMRKREPVSGGDYGVGEVGGLLERGEDGDAADNADGLYAEHRAAVGAPHLAQVLRFAAERIGDLLQAGVDRGEWLAYVLVGASVLVSLTAPAPGCGCTSPEPSTNSSPNWW